MELSPQALQAVHDATYYIVLNAIKALTPFLQRDSFLFWPFIVSSLVIAAGVWRWRMKRPWGEFFAEYFGLQLWWNRSTRADYLLYLANAMLAPLLFSYAITRGPALGSEPSEPVAGIIFTVLFFVAYDFGRFLAHCLLHDVPWLWEFHKVHHSAEVLTPITSYRAHPLELVLMAWGPVATTSFLTWCTNLVAPGAVSFYSFMGLHVLLWFFSLIDNLRHSPVWLSYGPRLGYWLLSPAHHQLHHSCEARHMGCNRGFDLALWDRLYGTLYVPGHQPERFRLGLGDGTEAQYRGLGRMYFLPFVTLAKRFLPFGAVGRR